ncbi:MAG: PIN-like domain-containing protein, partial [Solirubrobacterales bacterium]
ATLENQHGRPTGLDVFRDRIHSAVGANVGLPFTPSELETIYSDGADRYKRKIPPGYEDESDKAKQPDFVHGGATYRPMFGDLILWKQIIRYAKETKRKHLMLISDDEKSDWRHLIEHKGERLLLPNPELVDEIRREADVQVFCIYSSELFLRNAKERLGVLISENTVPQVTDVKEATRTEVERFDDTMSLLQVIAQQGNRRDAVLTCGYCGQGEIPLHFYEGDGTPKLADVLGFFHYWNCQGLDGRAAVKILVLGEDRDASDVVWPVTRSPR